MHRFFSLLLITIVISFQTAYAQQSNAETAFKFLSLLAEAKYEDALNLTAADFKAKVSPETLAKLWENLHQQLGPYESAQLLNEADKDATSLALDATFERYIILFTFSFNADHDIIGFFMPQQPKRKEDARKSPSNFPEEVVRIKVNGGIITGTIMTPKKLQSGTPIALIIAGSGPTDRDGNNIFGVQSNSYLLLAEALADNGIASFRYDKRLVGESADFETTQEKMVFQDFVDDAVYLSQFLKGRKEFGKLYIIGHSEGANVGLLASQQIHPAAFISIAGPGENLSIILENQLVAQPQLAEKAKPIISLLKQGKTTNNVPQELNGLFAPVIQNFIISSFKINPAAEIQKLSIPILIIGGTSDLQVPISNAERLKQANPGATLLLIKNMNHVLKTAPAEKEANLQTYTNANIPLNSDLVIGLVNFLQRR